MRMYSQENHNKSRDLTPEIENVHSSLAGYCQESHVELTSNCFPWLVSVNYNSVTLIVKMNPFEIRYFVFPVEIT